ncbi:hypothetical protein [Desulfovibrio inopinatus]|uniref:hypothetical protein n=1 Tax=Desulfovibrio inopinatus TaxID=102109 RepID=UPI000406A4E3|nr:hypothetical protein [Desulfovibrio inopinatus]
MNNFLEKYWSLLVAAAFFLVAIGMVSWLASSNLPGRGLLFKLVSKTPLEVNDATDNPPMDVYIGGKPVDYPYLTTIIVKNTGNIPIARSDFETPVSVTITNDSKIVQLYYEFQPEDISMKLHYTPKEVTLSPTLLNPGDNVFIQIFTIDVRPELSIRARILGVDSLITNEWNASEPQWGKVGWLHFSFFFLHVFAFLVFAVLLNFDAHARYIFMIRKKAIAFYFVLGVIAMHDYFTLLVNHTRTVFTSQLLLFAAVILAIVAAWKFIQDEDRSSG